MRSQEQLWLQSPLSTWSSSASGTANKQALWRAMAMKRLLKHHIHSQPHGQVAHAHNDNAFQYAHLQGHPQAGGLGYGETLTQQQVQVHVRGNGYFETRAQQQVQVRVHGHGVIRAQQQVRDLVQTGGLGCGKASAQQAHAGTRGEGYCKVVAQRLEARAQQHWKANGQARRHGYSEAPVDNQQGQVHMQVLGHGYGETLVQQQQMQQDQGYGETLVQQQQMRQDQGYGETLAQHQQQVQEPSAHRPLPKRLLPIPIPRRDFSTSPGPPPFGKSITIADTIQLTDLEFKIFNTLKAFLLHYDLKTQLRVAGGWVRDKLLGKQSGDIDIALDDMLGRTFCRKLSGYFRMVGVETHGFGVIKCNPSQAKHLEVAKMEILGVTIDFVNLRPHDYTESSSKPFTMQDFGTIVEDAFRRDLTINSLFYNIITETVEDPTGKGLSDLRAGIIATPLPAKDTFMDDPLRALRALRFVAILDYELHPDAKNAIDADIKLALAAKISRERIGGEVDRIFRCNQPLKAIKLLVETQLFPIVFSPPTELDIILPEGIERQCLHALEAIIDVVNHFGSSKLTVEHRKSLYLAAFLSPLRALVYEHKSKLVSISTAIIKESLKLRSIDAAMVATLQKTAGNYTSIRKLILTMDTADQGIGEPFISDLELQISYSNAKHQIGTLLVSMRGLWRAALLLGAVLEEDESLITIPYEKRKAELIRRSNLCIFLEEAVVKLGLEKMNGPIPFVERSKLSENG